MKRLAKLHLLDKIIKPWVAKKIKELLGVEEQAMISLVVGHLKNGAATPQSMLSKIGGILEEDADGFLL